ncbi:hypothetical protein F183_A53300 [Bryobacterales bacterium F-183]|nr:hypothetical protein F183_A53300 [Bryobacterales bacterium F-183]
MNELAWTSARRAAEWLRALLDPKLGVLQGGSDLRAYYKTAAAFQANGMVHEANAVLHAIERDFLRPGGDLDGSGVPWYSIYRTYPHSWICCAAMQQGRFDLAYRLREFIETFHNPFSGGFYAGETRDVEEVMTTSMAGLACLWSGKVDTALAAGGWLKTLWEAQPDIKKGLYTSWKNGALVTAFDEAEAGGALVDVSKPRQYYFQYGISAALLVSLYGATADRTWLDLAQRFLHASQYCGPDRYATPQSGKIGWGAAWVSRVSADPADRILSREVSKGLCALQNGDGSWLATGVYGGDTAEADSVTIDVTAEFATLQGWMALVRD